MTISYVVGKALYLNITNRCSCNCVFVSETTVIRFMVRTIYGWNMNPLTEEVLADLEKETCHSLKNRILRLWGTN